MDLVKELILAKKLALQAGKKIMEIYENKHISVTIKKEENRESPLTQADTAANDIIVTGLCQEFPEYAILTEEAIDDKKRLENDYVWIIDPLDGTKEFVNRNGEFTVNIALVYKKEPILGVIYVPVKGEMFYATKGNGAHYEINNKVKKINVSEKENIKEMILVQSKSHSGEKEAAIRKYFAETKSKGSSLKGCLIAQGEADAYFRFGPINEWDVCAMNLIVQEAGGKMTTLDGFVRNYNSENILIPDGFLVSNNKNHEKLLELK